ncbi:Ff.00g001800.m01.CDS01 [Fusarium sp. VM40]|nr:Ff.00g001800.m01.CDS01 [Fusarium sp. VM40]
MSAKSPKSNSPKSPQSPQRDVPAAAHTIEVDDDVEEDEDDPGLGADAESSTASITSSILHYRTINGRTYHSERGNAAYWGSNDERQSEAMDIAHHMFTLAQDGELHLAPLKDDIQKVLDVGCGTGIWAIDFADKYPSCEVIGTDISPIQPSWVPPNVKFEIEDCSQDWTYPPDSFDYVHLRYLVGCIPDWDKLFQEAYKVLKPGGWIETFEASPTIESDDGTVKPDSAMAQWAPIFIEASKKIGNTFTVIADDIQRSGIERAGFIDVNQWDSKQPLNPFPKDPKLKEIGHGGILDIVSALFYAILPIFLLKGLQMGLRTKIAIIILLGLGAGTVIVSIVRLKSLIQIVGSKDIAAALDLQLDSVLEFGISILTASLVAFRPLIKYMPFGSHGRSSSPGGHTGEGSRGPGASGSNNFEMNRRKYIHVSDPNRVDSDDGDSQRNILPDADNGRDWKKTDATITPKDK